MIEILGIFLQLLVFVLIFSFPFKVNQINSFFGLEKNYLNYFDVHAINIIFFIYLAIILSFTGLDLKTIFKFHLIISIIFFIFNFKEIKSSIYRIEKFNYLFFLLLIISIFFYISQNLKLEWDGHHWIEKALVFFNGLKIQEISNVKVHPHYPHIGSYIWAYFWKNSLLELEYLGRFFQPYLYVLSIFVVSNLIKNTNNNLKIVSILFLVLITFEPYLFAGYQEYLIFSSLIIASRYIQLLKFKKIENFKIIFLVFLIFYTLPWYKDEGIVYYFIFGAILIFFLNYNLKNKIIFFLILILLWYLQFLSQKYIIGIYDFPQKTSLEDLYNDIINIKLFLTKISKIFLHIFISFIKYPLWLVLTISFFGLLINKANLDKNMKYFIFCFLFNILFIIAVFFTFKSFDFMLKVSLDRLLFQTSGFYSVFIVIFLNKIKKI